MYKGTLKKIETLPEAGTRVGEHPLRTTDMAGDAFRLPQVGLSFWIEGEPINPEADYRQVVTSEVREIVKDEPGVVVFKTLNSLYEFSYTQAEA